MADIRQQKLAYMVTTEMIVTRPSGREGCDLRIQLFGVHPDTPRATPIREKTQPVEWREPNNGDWTRFENSRTLKMQRMYDVAGRLGFTCLYNRWTGPRQDSKISYPVVDLVKRVEYLGIAFPPETVEQEVRTIIETGKSHRDIVTLADVLRDHPNTVADDWKQYPSGGWAHKDAMVFNGDVPAGFVCGGIKLNLSRAEA